jgi:signal transduction histidine kinase
MPYQVVTEETRPDIIEQKQITLELAALLKGHREEIVGTWVKLKQQLPDSHYREQLPEELRASTTLELDAMIEALTTGSYAALEANLTRVCHTYHQRGFCLSEVTEAWLLGKEATLPAIRRVYPPDSSAAWEVIAQLDSCLRWIVGRFSQLYAAEASRRLEQQQARTALMLDMVQTANNSLELDEVLCRVAESITTVADVEYCGFFLVDEEQESIMPWLEARVSPRQAAASRRDIPASGIPQPIATFSVFLRQVVAQKKPFACYDVQADLRFDQTPPRRLGFRSILAVPFVVKGRVVAVAYALTFDQCRIFSEEQIELVWGIANTVGLAIENARLHQQVRHLAALEERNRLAREMHDNLSQALSILKLKLSLTSDLIRDNQLEQVRANLLEMKEIAAEAYTDTREAIFGLRTAAPTGADFLSSLRRFLVKYRASYGVEAQLVADERLTVALTIQTTTQVIRIIQEALTNVRKHAQASEAWVRIEPEGQGIRITVEDDGQGFDPAQGVANAPGGFGLQVMQERAESVGGRLEVEAQIGRGTRIVAWVPLDPEV